MTLRILAAHGTKDPAGQATVAAIAEAVAERVGPVRIAWLDVLTPTLADVLAESGAAGLESSLHARPVVIVPLLLSAGYHDRADIPAAVADVPQAVVAPVLGNDPRLIDALADRLVEAGWSGEPVVLGATGSARDTWHQLARRVADALAARLGVAVDLGVLSGPGTSVAEAVARSRGNVEPGPTDALSGAGRSRGNAENLTHSPTPRVAVSAYLIAEGFFHQRLLACGADVLSAPLGGHPALIDLLADRFVAAS